MIEKQFAKTFFSLQNKKRDYKVAFGLLLEEKVFYKVLQSIN